MFPFIVNALGVGLIMFVYWFFFRKHDEEAVEAGGSLAITVDGGYRPARIRVHRGVPTTLKFFRKDPSACLEEVVIPNFKIKQFLPQGVTTDVVITPDKPGVFDMHCGMNMYHGKIEVV